VRIRDGVGDSSGAWFASRESHTVGDDATTSFWRDVWCGGVPFHYCFWRLYDLTDNKAITIRNMCLSGWEEGGGVVLYGCGRRNC